MLKSLCPGGKPLSINSCILEHDALILPGSSAHVKVQWVKDNKLGDKDNELGGIESLDQNKEKDSTTFFVQGKDDKLLGLRVIEQLTDGVILLYCIGDAPLYLPAGVPMAKTFRITLYKKYSGCTILVGIQELRRQILIRI